MRTVHKYVLREVTNAVPTFEGARFLHVANQWDQITVWAEVNTLERECLRTLHVVGTGHEVPGGEHVGSAIMAGGDFVFHVYAEARAGEKVGASLCEEDDCDKLAGDFGLCKGHARRHDVPFRA